MNYPDPRDQIDLLKHIESITREINEAINKKGKIVFRRYPMTFALLILFGVIAVSEGAKGVMADLGILARNPWELLLIGLVILIFTGTLYKKLDK